MPLEKCVLSQLPFAPKDHPIFAILSVDVLPEDIARDSAKARDIASTQPQTGAN